MPSGSLTQDRTAIQPLPPTPKVDIPESRGFRIKSKILGKALHNDQLAHERLGKPTALAVFASDALVVDGVRVRGDPAHAAVRRRHRHPRLRAT